MKVKEIQREDGKTEGGRNVSYACKQKEWSTYKQKEVEGKKNYRALLKTLKIRCKCVNKGKIRICKRTASGQSQNSPIHQVLC